MGTSHVNESRGTKEQASENTSRDQPAVDGRRRRVLGAAAGGLSLAALGTVPSSAGASEDETLTIIHDTHFHGRLEDDVATIAEYWALIQEIQDEHENAIFVGAGDEFSPSVEGSFFEGEHIVEALNIMEPAGVAVGNHEDDFGVDVAEERFADSEFPWLATNMATENGNPYPETEHYVTTEVGGLTVGLIGFVPDGFAFDGAESLDIIESTQAAVDTLREEAGVDLVVAGSHLGGVSPKLEVAQEVDGLDAIVGDHYATIEAEAIEENDTVISVAGDEFDHLATVTLDADGALLDRELISLEERKEAEGIEPDAEMQELYEEYTSIIDEELDQEVAYAGVDLDARFDSSYNKENEYGNLVTEAMAHGTDSDVAIMNAGGIRSNRVYEAGPITAGELTDTLPFPDPVIRAEVTGEELEELLLDRVSTLPEANFGAQQQIQVHEIHYDWTGIEDRSVEHVHVAGEPIDHEATYSAALTNVMASILAEVRGEEEAEDQGELTDSPGNLLLEHAEELEYLEPKLHNRIHRFDEAVGEPLEVEHGETTISLTYEAPEHSLGIHESTFYAVNQHGVRIEATTVEEADDTVTVTFPTGAFETLATGVEEPTVRVFGGFDPDNSEDGYALEQDGELLDVPVAARFDYFLLRGDVPVTDLDLEPAGAEDNGGGDEDGDGEEDGNDDGTDDDENGDGTDDAAVTEDDATTDGQDDGSPGLGVLAALAGVGGGAYLYAQRGDEEREQQSQ